MKHFGLFTEDKRLSVEKHSRSDDFLFAFLAICVVADDKLRS